MIAKVHSLIKLLIIVILVSACSSPKNKKETLIVTQSPYQVFVKDLVGDQFDIVTLVPPGYNPHTFETKPQEMQKLAAGTIWFGVGEPFEQKLANTLKRTSYINLSQQIGLTSEDDLHIWMSPELVIKQLQVIARTLIHRYPNEKHLIEKNLETTVSKLRYTSHEILEILKPYRGDSIIVSHPSLTYFCQEFYLHQISLESEGKSPRPHDLAHITQEAKQKHTRCIFIQKGFDNRGALAIAKKLDMPIYYFDPSDPNYIDNLINIAHNIAEAKITQSSTGLSDDQV